MVFYSLCYFIDKRQSSGAKENFKVSECFADVLWFPREQRYRSLKNTWDNC